MFWKNRTYAGNKIDTLIGKETTVSGKLETKGIIRIEGNFDGEIHTNSDIFVGDGATIKANVKCANLTLGGKLKGKVEAENKFALRATGVLLGDVTAALFAVEEGAFFNGNFQMQTREKKQKAEIPAVKGPERKLQRKGTDLHVDK